MSRPRRPAQCLATHKQRRFAANQPYFAPSPAPLISIQEAPGNDIPDLGTHQSLVIARRAQPLERAAYESESIVGVRARETKRFVTVQSARTASKVARASVPQRGEQKPEPIV